MTPSPTTEEQSGRGRPRSIEADRAITEATMQLLMEEGFSALTIEAVAAEAGVGKTTIYRRFSSKVELVIDALSKTMHLDEIEDTGSLRSDLMAFHGHQGHQFSLRIFAENGGVLIGTLLAEKDRHPELIETFRRLVVDRRRKQFDTVLARAVKRGEVDEGVSCDYVASVVFGSLIARTVAGLEITEEAIEETIDSMLNGLLKR